MLITQQTRNTWHYLKPFFPTDPHASCCKKRTNNLSCDIWYPSFIMQLTHNSINKGETGCTLWRNWIELWPDVYKTRTWVYGPPHGPGPLSTLWTRSWKSMLNWLSNFACLLSQIWKFKVMMFYTSNHGSLQAINIFSLATNLYNIFDYLTWKCVFAHISAHLGQFLIFLWYIQ